MVFTCCSHPEEPSTSTRRRTEAGGTHPEPPPAAPAPSAAAGRSWWDAGERLEHAKRRPDSAPPRWRFSSISFPDLGAAEAPGSCLPPPDPSLLPGPFSVGGCEMDPWRRRVNLRKVQMSARDREREEDRRRRRRDINRDREVCSTSSNRGTPPAFRSIVGVSVKVQRCRNWAEYGKLLERRRRRPAGGHECLWNREVAPLHDPRHPTPTGELAALISHPLGLKFRPLMLRISVFSSGAVGENPCEQIYTFTGGGVQVSRLPSFRNHVKSSDYRLRTERLVSCINVGFVCRCVCL